MDYEIALRYILENYFDGDIKSVADEYEETMAMKCAVEAIEKQIPKKPKERRVRALYNNDSYQTVYVDEFMCPCCQNRIMYRAKIKRCLECGQAIDWRE